MGKPRDEGTRELPRAARDRLDNTARRRGLDKHALRGAYERQEGLCYLSGVPLLVSAFGAVRKSLKRGWDESENIALVSRTFHTALVRAERDYLWTVDSTEPGTTFDVWVTRELYERPYRKDEVKPHVLVETNLEENVQYEYLTVLEFLDDFPPYFFKYNWVVDYRTWYHGSLKAEEAIKRVRKQPHLYPQKRENDKAVS